MEFDYHLILSTISRCGTRGLIVCTDVDEQISILKVIDLTDPELPVMKEEQVDHPITDLTTFNEYMIYLEKKGSNWDDPTTLIYRSFDSLEIVNHRELGVDYFPYKIVTDPGEKQLAIAAQKGAKIPVIDTQTFEITAAPQAENSYYLHGLTFNEDGSEIAYMEFDQGGGKISRVDLKTGEQIDFGHKQVVEDLNTNGFITYHNGDPVVSICEMGENYSIIKYNKKDEKIWEIYPFNDENEAFIEENDLDWEYYGNTIWNNKHLGAVVDEKLYMGTTKKLFVIDLNSGQQLEDVAVDLPCFIHRVHQIRSNKLFMVDITGAVKIIDL